MKLKAADQRVVDLHAILREYGWRAVPERDGSFAWKKAEVPGLTVIVGRGINLAFLGRWPSVTGAGSKDTVKLKARLHSVALILGEQPYPVDLYRRDSTEPEARS